MTAVDGAGGGYRRAGQRRRDRGAQGAATGSGRSSRLGVFCTTRGALRSHSSLTWSVRTQGCRPTKPTHPIATSLLRVTQRGPDAYFKEFAKLGFRDGGFGHCAPLISPKDEHGNRNKGDVCPAGSGVTMPAPPCNSTLGPEPLLLSFSTGVEASPWNPEDHQLSAEGAEYEEGCGVVRRVETTPRGKGSDKRTLWARVRAASCCPTL